mmetsp:Transcript_158699/g.280318  ORF Transcript_158699/g.280318 Transcript_158699/m.280318 type:complete len:207 (+) Transcript_158699:249-869(+)
MVYLTTLPSALNLTEQVCGGVSKDLPVGLLPRKPDPVSVPVAREVNQTLSPSNGSTRKWWNAGLKSGKASGSLNPPTAFRYASLVSGPTTGPINSKSSASMSGASTPCPFARYSLAFRIKSGAEIGNAAFANSASSSRNIGLSATEVGATSVTCMVMDVLGDNLHGKTLPLHEATQTAPENRTMGRSMVFGTNTSQSKHASPEIYA